MEYHWSTTTSELKLVFRRAKPTGVDAKLENCCPQWCPELFRRMWGGRSPGNGYLEFGEVLWSEVYGRNPPQFGVSLSRSKQLTLDIGLQRKCQQTHYMSWSSSVAPTARELITFGQLVHYGYTAAQDGYVNKLMDNVRVNVDPAYCEYVWLNRQLLSRRRSKYRDLNRRFSAKQ